MSNLDKLKLAIENLPFNVLNTWNGADTFLSGVLNSHVNMVSWLEEDKELIADYTDEEIK